MRKFLPALIMGLFHFGARAQCSLYPVSLQDRVENSAFIAEGRISSSTSFWDTDHKRIYTIHNVQLYRVFKGNISGSSFNIITDGGLVGETMLKVSPGLELEVGATGVFMGNTAKVSMPVAISNIPGIKLKTYADQQGFIRYNTENFTASDIFTTYNSIRSSGGVYASIEAITKTPHKVINNVIFGAGSLGKTGFVPLAVPTVTSVSPLIVAAGIDTVISIRGNNFESSRGTGFVQFRNADDGGSSFITADTFNYVTWSDTLIRLRVPTHAGTGLIRVTNASASASSSTDTLKVQFSQLNVTYSGNSYKPAHRNMNSGGGYTWRINPKFKQNADRLKAFYRALDSWRCGTLMNWVVGDTSIIDDISSDGVCIVRIDDLDPGKLGVCWTWWSGCSNGSNFNWYVAELDIEFDSLINWQYGPTAPSGSQYDFESVAAHELGHGHQLGHVINSTEIMHFSIGNGQSKRVLSSNDLLGGNYVKSQSVRPTFCSKGSLTPVNVSTCITSTPTARFGANKSIACLNETVVFTDSSYGTISSYFWDFGSSASPATANSKGPHSVTYSTPGPKNVKLVTYGVAGNDSVTRSPIVSVTGVPVKPAFIFGDSTPCQRTVVYEINKTAWSKLYRWSASDAVITSSNDSIVLIKWNSPGMKTLKVRAVNDCDSSEETVMNVLVKTNRGDISDTSGLSKLGDSACIRPVHLYDSKVDGFIQKWYADGGTFFAGIDTGRNVQVKWQSLGLHNIRMVLNTDCDSLVQNADIMVTDRPDISFNFSAVKRTVTFTSVGEAKNYFWDFGDGMTSSDKNPVHTYDVEGSFNVQLIVSNDCGADTAMQGLQVSSVKNIINEAGLKVVPNPVQSEALISTNVEGPALFELYDNVGRLVMTKECNSREFIFHSGNLPAGVYYFRIVMPGGRFAASKIVLQ